MLSLIRMKRALLPLLAAIVAACSRPPVVKKHNTNKHLDSTPEYASTAPKQHSTRPRLESQPSAAPAVPVEAAVGVRDVGIFSDLDSQVQLPLGTPKHATLRIVPRLSIAILLDDQHPLKVYPLGGPATLTFADLTLRLRPGDQAELSRLPQLEVLSGAPPLGDADADGIPDALDIVLGAEKAVLNGAEYSDDYFTMKYPGGDAPRKRGACVDVIVRALRNAGYDLQTLIAKDIRRAPQAYGVEKRDSSIDHRRVRNLFVYLKRHFERRSASKADADDPLVPGDIVLLDTLPKPGPDHVGIVSTRRGASGHFTLVNNWTFGHQTAHMDLLASYDVMHRFRVPPTPARR